MLKTIRDSYKRYKESCKSPVDMKTYLLLTSNYNKFLIDKVLDGEEVTLPSRLGALKVQGLKQKVSFGENGEVKGLAPDWVKTKKLWDKNEQAKLDKKLIYHTNSHTDGIRYKFLWKKSRVLVENKTLYSLRLTRANKRALHKKIIEGKEYITK